VLARLAVDSADQKQGLGTALLKDALPRTIAAAQIAGIRAVLRLRCQTTRSASTHVPDFTSVPSIQ
jgi:predicted N-acetyltransferase YhbS